MSKTIPIWTCVLNRAIAKCKNKMRGTAISGEGDLNVTSQHGKYNEEPFSDWDCSLHLPLWVPPTEKAAIEDRLEDWVIHLEASGADISSVASSLQKPLRPLWISPKTVIWLNEVPEYNSWDFTPIILVSASSASGNFQHRTSSEFSWSYISGAGDDEESWARGLSPALFWKYAYDIINSGPDMCNQKVADIVEKDRVYRAHRGHNAPQLSVKTSKSLVCNGHFSVDNMMMDFEVPSCERIEVSSSDTHTVSWVGSTNLAVGATRLAGPVSDADCILNCDSEPPSVRLDNPETYLHLPIVSSKLDRISLIRHLPSALNFARINLRRWKKLMICCNNGDDISVCVCLAILTSLFTNEGLFDDGKAFSETSVTKVEMRRRLVFICKYAVNARPSRGNLRQVFNFLIGGNVSS